MLAHRRAAYLYKSKCVFDFPFCVQVGDFFYTFSQRNFTKKMHKYKSEMHYINDNGIYVRNPSYTVQFI